MHRNHPAMPLAATLLAIALFSVMDALMKRASMAGGVYSTMLMRAVLAGAIITVLWRLRGVVPRQLRLMYLADRDTLSYAPDADELDRFERTARPADGPCALQRSIADHAAHVDDE